MRCAPPMAILRDRSAHTSPVSLRQRRQPPLCACLFSDVQPVCPASVSSTCAPKPVASPCGRIRHSSLLLMLSQLVVPCRTGDALFRKASVCHHATCFNEQELERAVRSALRCDSCGSGTGATAASPPCRAVPGGSSAASPPCRAVPGGSTHPHTAFTRARRR